MKKFWIGLLALVPAVALAAAPLPVAKPEDVGMSSQRLAKIDAAVQQEVKDGSFRGMVVMIARKGKLVYHKAFGNQTVDKPMAEDSIFRVYSMTKPLATVGAMILVEDGKVQLTDNVSKYLPGFDKLQVSVAKKDAAGAVTYDLVPAERQMTVQDLMRHSAGLAYGEITGNAPVKEAYEKAGLFKKDIEYDSRDLTPDEQVKAFAGVPLQFQPGTTWQYSMAVDVLGRVVEKASGQRLGDFLEARLFKPLRMADTAFWVPPAKMGRLADPIKVDRFSNRTFPLMDVSALPKNDSGGAGSVSTASDYLRFTQMMLNGGVLDGQRILSPNTVKLMSSDHLGSYITPNPLQPGEVGMGTKGYTFGLGFAVRQADGIAGVAGSAGDYTWAGYSGTYFWIDPKEQLAVVYLTQAPSPYRSYFRKMMRNLVYQAINN